MNLSTDSSAPPSQRVAPRIWPAVVIVLLQFAIMIGCSTLAAETAVHFMGLVLAPPAATLLLLVWWLAFSRVSETERMVGLGFLVVVGAGCAYLAEDKIRFALMVYGLAALNTAVALIFVLTPGLRWTRRRWLLAFVVVATCASWTAFRLDGLDGNLMPQLGLRWRETAEAAFVASVQPKTTSDPSVERIAIPTEASPGDWPEFRGSARDGKVHGVTFKTDWNASPPREVWRRAIGPGWSSFAVVGGTIFTQEQRGEDELVSCYALEDGREVWVNTLPTRFQETIAGPGPRATPTFSGGRLFALGATGTLQCIDPGNGASIWQRDLTKDVDAGVPEWGFSSSPLVFEDTVVVFSGAGSAKSVVAYDKNSGELRWSNGRGTKGYSSAHLARVHGDAQVLMVSNAGLQSFGPADGTLRWEHIWLLEQNARIVQPLVLGRGTVFLGTGYGFGTRRLDVKRAGTEWQVEERWTSRRLKPYFNDFLEHNGDAYGFDARIFTCIDLETGERRWKGGRYGHGQVLLVVDAGVLVVLGEQGQLVLLEATPEEHREIAQLEMLAGKTWNHPVIAHRKLLLRNGAEMVCLELPK